MNKLKQSVKAIGISTLMSLLPAKFIPAIAQSLKQSQAEKAFDNGVKDYNNKYSNRNSEFWGKNTYNELGHCIDGAGILTESEDKQIEQILKNFYTKDSIEVVFLTNTHIKNGLAEQFAVDYGNARGVGDNKYFGNGIVIMQNPKDRVLGIGVGKNIPFVINRREAKDKILDAGKSSFRKGDEITAVNAMLKELDKILTKKDRKELSSDKNAAKTKLTAEQEKHKKQIAIYIFEILALLGSTAGGYIYTKNQKNKYDKYVSYYNNMARNFSKIGRIKELDDKSTEIIKKLKEDPKYAKITQEMGFLHQAAASSLSNIYNLKGSDIYNDSWEDFLLKNGTKTINSKILDAESVKFHFDSWRKDVENNLGEIIEINDKITKSNEIVGNLSDIAINNAFITKSLNKHENDGFVFADIQKTIDSCIGKMNDIILFLSDGKYYENIGVLDNKLESYDSLNLIKDNITEAYDKLKLYIDYYTNKDKYINDNQLDQNLFSKTSDVYSDLMSICPRDFVSAKISLDDIKNNIALHPKLVERINNIYVSKDLEKLATAMNVYIDNAKDTKEKIAEAKSLLDKQSKAKSDCEVKIKKITKIDDIYYYDDELKEKNQEYIILSNKVLVGKNDWISLYTELVQFDNEYSSLKSKADKKEENDNKPVSTYKSDDNNTNNTRNSNNNNTNDNNRGSGGGLFDVGGGGDDTY